MTGTKEASVAILGFGVAGLNAALALRTAGYDGEIRVFSDAEDAPYSPILTSYYAGGDKAREECHPWSPEAIDALGLTIESEPALELDVRAHVVRTPSGEFSYDKCVLATGARPSSAGFPAGCGYEPLMLRTMEDADTLQRALSRPGCARILVSGASMVALKIVEAGLRQGLDVTLVGMSPHVLDFNALPAAAERFERGLRDKGVALRLGQTIADVEVVDGDGQGGAGTASRKLKVTFSNGDVDAFDEIAVAHGVRSALDYLAEGAIETDQGVIVDDNMRTSDPDVYAAGDVAQATELVSGQKRIVGIWKNAALQGQCAGTAIAAELAGRPIPTAGRFAGSISSNTIAVDGTLFISAGSVELGCDREVEVREGDDMTVVYVYEKAPCQSDSCQEGCAEGSRRLVGFNITSDTDVEGSVAYDTGAMLTMRIEEGCRR